MQENNPKAAWETYREQELARIRPTLLAHGFVLAEEQPHISGERYLMHAVTTKSGRKLILLGERTTDHVRVVIKATSDPSGIQELAHERACRALLHKINFAYDTFHSPEEIAYLRQDGMHMVIQKFIQQTQPFLARPLPEQFQFALRAFKAQESAHATTSAHIGQIKRVFESYDAKRYLDTFATFEKNITTALPEKKDLLAALARAKGMVYAGEKRIEQYCNFLTHTDFVPHNIRIFEDIIYLLDFSSLRFGNKYEGWARFLNFMTLYNPPLEAALAQYVADNRAPEEAEALWLMRMYRLGEIIWYYVRAYGQSVGNLKELNHARIEFWTKVLERTIDQTALPEQVRTAYIRTRDTLRDTEEKKRQIGLH